MLCLFSSQYSNSASMILPCLYMALQGPGQGKGRNSGRRNNNNYTRAKFPCDRLELLQRSSEPVIHVHFSWDSFGSGGQQLMRYVFIESLALTLA